MRQKWWNWDTETNLRDKETKNIKLERRIEQNRKRGKEEWM